VVQYLDLEYPQYHIVITYLGGKSHITMPVPPSSKRLANPYITYEVGSRGFKAVFYSGAWMHCTHLFCGVAYLPKSPKVLGVLRVPRYRVKVRVSTISIQ
jgi:hypothetical protein